jgi:hypothetical protein
MLLNKDQQARLRAVASGLYGDHRKRLNTQLEEQTTAKINRVLAQLHAENPSAFVDTAVQQQDGTVVFTDINHRMGQREFYNEPKTIRPDHYRGFVEPYKPRLKFRHGNT